LGFSGLGGHSAAFKFAITHAVAIGTCSWATRSKPAGASSTGSAVTVALAAPRNTSIKDAFPRLLAATSAFVTLRGKKETVSSDADTEYYDPTLN
jgi:hypothetical protein